MSARHDRTLTRHAEQFDSNSEDIGRACWPTAILRTPTHKIWPFGFCLSRSLKSSKVTPCIHYFLIIIHGSGFHFLDHRPPVFSLGLCLRPAHGPAKELDEETWQAKTYTAGEFLPSSCPRVHCPKSSCPTVSNHNLRLYFYTPYFRTTEPELIFTLRRQIRAALRMARHILR